MKANDYLASYRHDGETYVFTFKAASMVEAQSRLRSIRGNATLDGELKLRVPVPEAAGGILARILKAIRP